MGNDTKSSHALDYAETVTYRKTGHMRETDYNPGFHETGYNPGFQKVDDENVECGREPSINEDSSSSMQNSSNRRSSVKFCGKWQGVGVNNLPRPPITFSLADMASSGAVDARSNAVCIDLAPAKKHLEEDLGFTPKVGKGLHPPQLYQHSNGRRLRCPSILLQDEALDSNNTPLKLSLMSLPTRKYISDEKNRSSNKFHKRTVYVSDKFINSTKINKPWSTGKRSIKSKKILLNPHELTGTSFSAEMQNSSYSKQSDLNALTSDESKFSTYSSPPQDVGQDLSDGYESVELVDIPEKESVHPRRHEERKSLPMNNWKVENWGDTNRIPGLNKHKSPSLQVDLDDYWLISSLKGDRHESFDEVEDVEETTISDLSDVSVLL